MRSFEAAMLMNRRVVAAGILALWIGALLWLVRREYFQPVRGLLADQPLNVSPTATYYRLSLSGVQIGFQSTSVDTVADTVRVTELMLLNLPVEDRAMRVEARTSANLTRSLDLRTFESSMRGDDSRFDVRGNLSADSVLELQLESTEGVETFDLAMGEGLVLPTVMPMRLAFGSEIALGSLYRLETFDPLLLDQNTVNLRVVAESIFVVADSADQPDGQLEWIPARWDTVHAWYVIEESDGLAFEAWIDDLGQIVTARTGTGFLMERTAYEIAYENFGRGDSVPVLPAGPGVRLSRRPAAAAAPPEAAVDRLNLRLTGIDPSAYDLNAVGQHVAGDTLVVSTPDLNSLRATYRIPNRDGALVWFRRSEPLIPSEDPRIEAQARQIVGSTRNAARAAERLARWVSTEMEKRVSAGLPSALSALNSRSGDSSEHAALFVAMARAVGLPARTVSGLLYLNRQFYYHAWAEVYLADWVPVDPTFGQLPADAAHVRLAIGGLARQLELVRTVGQPTIEVLEIQPE